MRGVLVGVCAAVVAAAPALAQAAEERPSVRLASRAPVVVHGTDFRPGERVTVVVSSGERRSRSVRAGAAGAFRARFALSLGRCAALTVQAFGSAGSRARLVLRKAPACIPGA